VHEGVPPALRLLALTSLGAVVFAGGCAWRAPEILEELRALRRRRGPLAAPVGAKA
jgi:hypothetical protein